MSRSGCLLAREDVPFFGVAVESDKQSAVDDFSTVELALATRNHGFPLESLRYDLTPIGLHYLLIHFDIPFVDASTLAARDRRRGRRARCRSRSTRSSDGRRASVACTLECAGNGRARLTPRPLSQPWLEEAIGNAEWTGTPLAPLLEEAGIEDDAVEVLFTGLDRGDPGRGRARVRAEPPGRRSAPAGDAPRLRDQRPAAAARSTAIPLRLIVPGWYGMTHVKWLDAITAITEPFEGYQQAKQYRTKRDRGRPRRAGDEDATRARCSIPPGIPDFPDRQAVPRARPVQARGPSVVGLGADRTGRGQRRRRRDVARRRARRADRRVRLARLDASTGTPTPGEHELCSRATDGAGNTQPDEAEWNTGGYVNNAVQRVLVTVQ